MWDIVEPQFHIEMFDCRCNAVLFILRRDDDREQLQQRLIAWDTIHMQPDMLQVKLPFSPGKTEDFAEVAD